MIRTQVYLTQEEKLGIEELAERTGKSQSELIRLAIDRYLERVSDEARNKRMQEAFGLWREREDLPDIDSLRREWDRQQ